MNETVEFATSVHLDLQAWADDEAHRKVVLVFMFTDFINQHNAQMIKALRRFCLAMGEDYLAETQFEFEQ